LLIINFLISQSAHKYNKVVLGGENLEKGFLSSYCNHGLPLSDMCLFLNFENNENTFLVKTTADPYVISDSFFIYKISNSLNKVVSKFVMPLDSVRSDHTKATKHSNGKDWWIILNDWQYRGYYSLLFTEKGIEKINKVKYNKPGKDDNATGQCNISILGTKYVRADNLNDMHIYDFDRCTGLLSNEKIIKYSSKYQFDGNGVCVSPNNRFLYQSYNRKLLQFDLQASDIEASKVLIDTFDGFVSDPLPVTFYLMGNGADGRIFMACTSGVEYMHYINKPNEKGKACDFRQHGITLTTYNLTMPNIPNYRLGPSSVICTTATTEQTDIPLRVYPNPAQDVLHIESESGEAIKRIVVYNAIGEQVYVSDYQGIEDLDVNTSAFKNGIYVLRVQYQNLQVSSVKVSILR
jgi:hypothetical protein